MVLEFIGADREVTGSCHYLTFGDTHILIDCGMEQGADLYVNQEIPVNPSLIDYVFVTHAHMTTQVFCRSYTIMVSGAPFLRQRRQQIYVTSC